MTPLEFVVAAIFAVQPNTYQFQSKTIQFQDMGRGAIGVELMQLSSNGGEPMHVLLRFDQPMNAASKEQLAVNGLTVQHPLGGATYIAVIDPQMIDIAGIRSVSNIKEIRTLEPEWKLHQFLAEGNIPTWTMPQPIRGAAKADPVVAIYAMLHADVELQLASEDMAAWYGAKIRSTIPTTNTVVMELPYSAIRELVEEDRVLYVEPALPKFTELNDSNRIVTQANTAQQAPYNLDGSGVTVMVYDGGYGLSSHADFGGRHTVRDGSGLSDHATHVAGTIGGDGTASGGQYTGMAPAVTIESYGFQQDGGLQQGFLYTDPGDLALDYGDAINLYGAVLANNSIGTNTAPNGFPCDWTGNYGITSALIDSVVRGDLGGDIRIVWANGNERGSSNCGTSYHSTAPPACAKNHITVGAINSNDESMTSFSSWGPTDDGRIKPDISAPGCQSNSDGGVTSCSSSGGYGTKCGTSMACPTVVGISALIMQDWRIQFPTEPDMVNSTLKALLAHTAQDKFNAGPDCQYGYGSVRVVNAIDHIRADNFAELEISHGETIEMLIFADQPGLIKATIAWDDVPAVPLMIPSLVNDIDIVIIDPNGNTHYPWTIDPNNPGNPAVRTQADHLNNIEQVQIDAGQAGLYRIVMTGFNIAQGPQQFGLMASPLLIQCASSGLASLDRSVYACGATIELQVVDCDLNLDDGAIDTTTVTVTSTSGDQTIVLLTESGDATAAFRGSIVIGVDIQASQGDTLTLTYIDADDGQGGNNVSVNDIATVDCTAPLITSVTITNVMTYDAMVSVSTDEDTQVNVSIGTACHVYDDVVWSTVQSTDHQVQLSSLNDNTTYYIEVEAVDAAGNSSTDDNNGGCFTFTTNDVPDYFTEEFINFDLDGLSVTFTPFANVDGYRACAESITELPTNPLTGTPVSLSDDDYAVRQGSLPVVLYGVPYNQFYISSNGRITMSSGSTYWIESLCEHFSQPAIDMMWDDLNPSNGGIIRFASMLDRAVVTFVDVPEYSPGGSNTFQCEMFYNGVIRLSWLGVDSNDSIVGLSAGGGQPVAFAQSDLSGAIDCGPPQIPGDANGDGFVTITDILLIMNLWGPCAGCSADLNGDGVVDILDLLEVIGNWGI